MGNYLKGGYEKKYIISKTSGKPVDPDAEYFVLRLDKDPHALKAMETYMWSVGQENKELGNDLIAVLSRNRNTQQARRIAGEK